MQKSLTRWWLLLGVAALAIAGLFSLVLVAARAPETGDIQIFTDMFHKALVVHVDLSVLVWFLAITCMMWSIAAAERKRSIAYVEQGALVCFALAVTAITLSPLDPHGAALMSNYIPVIYSPVFFLGLSLLACGVMLMTLQEIILLSLDLSVARQPLAMALSWSPLMVGYAFMLFYSSYKATPAPAADGRTEYYDAIFWAGGHILQFAFVTIMMLGWLLLLQRLYNISSIKNKLMNLLPLLPMVIIAMFALSSDAQTGRQDYTDLMIVGNGLPAALLAFLMIPSLWILRGRNALWSSLLMSIILFLYGGALGGIIHGQNVVIPAHYHGSIVGVTLGFMGVAYLLLPRFGYRDVSMWKTAFWQPIVYGTGQLMHVTGLAVSGGYGVLRKTPGGVDALPASVKAALGFMGLGGLLAIIGGLMFVIVVYKSVRSNHAAA